MLIDDGDDIAGATPAFGLAAHMSKNRANARPIRPRAEAVADVVVRENIAGADDQDGLQFGKVSNYLSFQHLKPFFWVPLERIVKVVGGAVLFCKFRFIMLNIVCAGPETRSRQKMAISGRRRRPTNS